MTYSIRLLLVPDDQPNAEGEWRAINLPSSTKGLSWREAVDSVKGCVPKGYRVVAAAGGNFE
jgi:hypothetical protein